MGVFDDLPLPPAPPTQSTAASVFADLPLPPASPSSVFADLPLPPPVTTGDLTAGPGPGLGERLMTAAGNAVNGTLLGGAVNAITSGFYSGVPNPIDPNTGQPLPGPSLEQQAVQAEQAPAQAYAQEPRATGVLGQGATVLGTLIGGAASPESLVAGPEGYGAVRAGEAVLPTILKSAGVQAAVQGAANAGAQGENIAAGEQTGGFDPSQVAESAGTGALIGAAAPAAGAVMNAVRGTLADVHVAPDAAEATTSAVPAQPVTAPEPTPAMATTGAFDDLPLPPPPSATEAPSPETPVVPQDAAASAPGAQAAQPVPQPEQADGSTGSAAEAPEVLAAQQPSVPDGSLPVGGETPASVAAEANSEPDLPQDTGGDTSGAVQPARPTGPVVSDDVPEVPETDGTSLAPSQDVVSESASPSASLSDAQNAQDARSGIGVVDQGHFNAGTSPYVQVFRDAGYDPDTATSLPIQRQNAIIGKHLQDAFGLKDVDVSPRQDPKEVRDQLSNFYNGGREMAAALGMPTRAIGLDGKLSLTTKPFTKKTAYLGAYYPGAKAIVLPGRSNSFAHEWTHAFDHHMAEVVSQNPKAKRLLSTTAASAKGLLDRTPGSSVEGFANVMRAIYGKDAASGAEALRLQYLMKSKDPKIAFNAKLRFDELKSRFVKNAEDQGGEYWKDPAELLARSHEAYVSQTIRDAGGDARGVAKPAHSGVADDFDRLYPQEDDRARIFQAYRDMHDALRREEILGKGSAQRPNGQDIVDPTQWHKMADTQRDPGLTAALKREATAFQNFRGNLRKNLGYNDQAADPGRLTFMTRRRDELVNAVATARTWGNRLTKRQPEGPARRAFQEIMDHLTPAEHVRDDAVAAHHHLGQVFEEDVRMHARSNINKLVNILDAHKLGNMKPDEKLQLRHVLTEGDKPFTAEGKTTEVPANIKGAAGKIRRLLDDEYDRNTQAGMDVGYARNGYFPRMYDDHKIFGDEHGFKAQASKLHSLMFDQDVGDDPEKLLAAHDRLTKDTRDGLPQDVQDGVAALRKNLKDQDKLTAQLEVASDADKPALQAKLDDLRDRASALHDQYKDAIQATYAKAAANHWFTRINAGDPTDFDTRGPDAGYTNKRVLPPEADEIMRNYMVHDPTEALPSYFQSSARKVAFAKRFGPGGKRLDDLFKQASDGGARGEDIAAMRRLVQMVTGRQKSGLAPQVENLLNGVHAMGSIALMPRAMWSSLTEPMSMLIRTGNMKATLSTFAGQIGDIVGTANSKERAELANAIGITMSHLHDSIMQDRSNADYVDSPRLSHLMTNFYRRSGLTALTNSQRRQTMAGAHIVLRDWASKLLDGNARQAKDATSDFRQMGVRDADHQAFAKWLQAHPGLPSLKELDTPEGRQWAQSVTRLTDKIIQDPGKIDKPLSSQSPLGRLAFGLMSFNYSWYHNIIEHFMETHEARIKEGYQAARAPGSGKLGVLKGAAAPAGRMVAHGLVAAAATYAAALAATTLRERLFNGAEWDQHEKNGDLHDWLSDLAIQRTGINGPLDPLIQAATGLKYQRDLSSLVAGAQAGYFLQAGGDILKAFTAPSPDTNTSGYNAVKGAWQALGVPAVAALFSALPGGPGIGAAYGLGMQYLTGQGVGDDIATAVAGPKGTGVGGVPPPGADASQDDELNPADSELAPQPDDTSGSGGAPLGIPAGLWDDIANPAARIALPLFERLPVVGKAAVVGGAGVAGLHGLARYFGQFDGDGTDTGN